jgi:polyhydroxyalkanoate synthesis regulator phasin
MTRHRIRIALLGLVFLLGLSTSSKARAGDAELFADLIPGTELTNEELDQYYGRGVGLLGLTRVLTLEAVDSAEYYRERIQELIEETRGEVFQQRERAQSFVDEKVETAEHQRQSHAQDAQNLANNYLDDIRARISEIQGRFHRKP